MRKKLKSSTILILLTLCLLSVSCKKENEIIDNNSAPDYYGVPTIKVQNYINRLFIDLIGREPLDREMDSLVSILESNNLNFSSREQIIKNLQFDTISQSNGDNFKQLFFNTIYGLQKARFLEGVPDVDILKLQNNAENAAKKDSLSGKILEYHWKKKQAKKYEDVLASDTAFKNNTITFNEVCKRMCYNGVFDIINMNSFNYVNAVFDNNLYRFPTSIEFDASYKMVEKDEADLLFGISGSNKLDFTSIVTNSKEFNNGAVIWIFRSFLSRFPTPSELYQYSSHYETNKNMPFIIREVMKTDEYANF